KTMFNATPALEECPTQHRYIEGDHCELRPAMPVMETLQQNIGGLHSATDALVGLQHLFGSTATLIDRLVQGRISPVNVFLLGKPYSTNPRVMHSLQQDSGYWVHPHSTRQTTRQENDEVMDSRIEQTLQRVQGCLAGSGGRSLQRILLIDDGGRAIRMLHRPGFADIRHRFTCVEQTRCGTRNISDLDLQVPVINVAESWAKLHHESPLIAESVNRELTKQLRIMAEHGISAGNRALVIGYGSIGSAVACELRSCGYEVAVFETDQAKLQLARREGFTVRRDLQSALRSGGYIIGCTGTAIMTRADHKCIRAGSILISASSADAEFQGWELRKAGTCLGRPESWLSDDTSEQARHPCFSLYHVDAGQGGFHLVNGGFPVNFNGGVDPIPPAKIQLTRSLLYLGAVQASHTTESGLHNLDERGQRMIISQMPSAACDQAA
ncbi:MAG: hypothetical protein DRQ48_08200, partial [Gammaproteobacteria bacterium]